MILLSTLQVAERLHVDPRTVQRRAEAGLLPVAGKLPGGTGAYVFAESDIAEMEQAS